jgi:DNA-binding transcriptional LysR family regulator
MTRKLWTHLGLDLVSLRVFAAAAEENNLARAAEREHIALSAASRRISDFEARAGVLLFERRDRGMVLTAPGRRLLDQLQDVFALLDRIALDLDEVRVGARGHVRIHAHMSAMASDLPEIIASFMALHPGIDLELVEQTSVEAIHAVQTGSADIGIVSGNIPANELDRRHWKRDELVVVLPPGHPLGPQPRVSFQELLDEPFIAMQPGSALLALYRDQAKKHGRSLRERAHAASFESARKLVSVGLGVTILPASAAVASPRSEIVVRPLDEPWARRSLVICTREPSRLATAVKLFLEHLSIEDDTGDRAPADGAPR